VVFEIKLANQATDIHFKPISVWYQARATRPISFIKNLLAGHLMV